MGRRIPTKVLYKNDESWSGFLHRVLPSFDVPMALLPWVDGLQVISFFSQLLFIKYPYFCY